MGIPVERDEMVPRGQFFIYNKASKINVPEIKFHTDSPYEIYRVPMGKQEDYIDAIRYVATEEPFRYIEPDRLWTKVDLNTLPTEIIGEWGTKECVVPPNAADIAWGKWNPVFKKPRKKAKTAEQEPEEISDEAFMNILNT